MNRTVQSLMCAVTVVLLLVFLMNAARAELGTWVLKTGEVVNVPCPTQAAHDDETMTLRLPSGCRVLHPRIGYTVAQDLRLREETATLRARVDLLVGEVAASRAFADSELARAGEVLSDTRQRLEAQRERADQAEVALTVEQAKVDGLNEMMLGRTMLAASLGFCAGAVGAVVLVLAL